MSLQVVPASGIPDGWMGLDIGPDSIKTFSEALDTTKTVIWNGPMGVFEFEKFAAGTEVCLRRWKSFSCLLFGFAYYEQFVVWVMFSVCRRLQRSLLNSVGRM